MYKRQVSHHGPENQFYVLKNPPDGSPYIDYPVVAFYPEDGVGVIHAIPKGPENFRDRPLKRFMAEKRRSGYDLYENLHSPGWSWSHHRDYNFNQGWDDRDDPDLPDSPEEIPFPTDCTCDKNEASSQDPSDNAIAQVETILDLKGQEVFDYIPYPNPAVNVIQVDIIANKRKGIEYALMTIDGQMVQQGELQLNLGKNALAIDVAGIQVGSYFLILNDESKIISKMIHINR